MKRAVPLLVAAVAAALWWVWPREVAPLPPPPSAPSVLPVQARVLPAATPPPTPAASAEPDWTRRAEAVASACDLAVQTRCDGETCAAVVTMPDLDRLTGWLSLSLRSPRFVLSTAARDLGVPIDGMPCGVAVERLVSEAGVRAVELPDGTEVWCTVDGDPDAGRGLCRALAADRIGGAADRFTGDALRELSFR